MSQPKIQIGLFNPKSVVNVGAVMRASGCFGVNNVRYTGSRYGHAAKFHTDTHNASSSIPLVQVEDMLQDLGPNTKVVCVELVEGATALPDFTHPQDALYLFGPEDGSIDQAIVDKADAVVYIPTAGCLNMAATVNVLLYDRLAKANAVDLGDELIRASRDRNNRLKLKKVG